MGLDFSYLLYFKREQLWDALQGIVAIAVPHHPPTTICFPEGERQIPLDSWLLRDKTVYYDDPEFSFSIVLNFDRDDEIEEYLGARGFNDDEEFRSPPHEAESQQASIGYIYLYIYNDLSRRISAASSTDYVLFDFGTTGTRMSLLFDYSPSIRKTFIVLLERCNGVCGIFNRESDGGEAFWVHGNVLSEWIGDPYLTGEEIEDLVKRFGK